MPRKPLSDKHKESSSSKQVTHAAEPQEPSEPTNYDMSAEQIEEILRQAHYTVKPIIKREALNEIIDEDILGFKLL